MSASTHFFSSLGGSAVWIVISSTNALGFMRKVIKMASAISDGWIIFSGMYSASGRDQVMGVLVWAGFTVSTLMFSDLSACMRRREGACHVKMLVCQQQRHDTPHSNTVINWRTQGLLLCQYNILHTVRRLTEPRRPARDRRYFNAALRKCSSALDTPTTMS